MSVSTKVYVRNLMIFLNRGLAKLSVMFISFVRVQICHDIQVDPKKRPILLFIPKLCFTFFFSYILGGVDSRPGRLF